MKKHTKVKAIIQHHYPERISNIDSMVQSLIDNGLTHDDIVVIADYSVALFSPNYHLITSEVGMPINWWHGIGAYLDCDYVALLCDDLKLKKNSISSLVSFAEKNKDVHVWGYEGAYGADTNAPYTDSMTHTSNKMMPVEFLIRFYFATPFALSRAVALYNHPAMKKTLRGHDDLLLSLSNRCAIIPTTEDSGWEELPTWGKAYSARSSHYDERNSLILKVRDLL